MPAVALAVGAATHEQKAHNHANKRKEKPFMTTTAPLTPAQLGWKYIVSGLGLFITGFLIGFIPILHYMHPLLGDVGPVFLKHMTLWWGCPAILAELTLKTGSLGMMVIGFAYLAIQQQDPAGGLTRREQIARKLCSYGLIAEVVTAGVFYVVCNLIWPNFYFEPVEAGKNLWLAVQGLSIAFYVGGGILAVSSIRKRSATLGSAVVR
jgi:hypothetical protein